MPTTTPTTTPAPKTDAQALIATVTDHGKAHHLSQPNADPLRHASLISVPQNRTVKDFTDDRRRAAEYLKPARRRGTADLQDAGSVIAWADRFTDADHGALFATLDRTDPSITCIADYHRPGAPDPTAPDGDPSASHCHHRARYAFPLSDEWQAWAAICGQPLEKDDMGEFLEARAMDILNPTPAMIAGKPAADAPGWERRLIETAQHLDGRFATVAQLLALSKSFQVHETSEFQIKTDRDTGEANLHFVSEHRDATGTPLRIPNLLVIAIPVFTSGAVYRMPVRFRYRKTGAAVRFILTRHNPDAVMDDAIRGDVDRVQQATGLPLFWGIPESMTGRT